MLYYETHSTDSTLERLLTRYRRTGSAIPVDFRKLVPCFTSAERATHLLHPYPAKLLMHIPFFFLANSLLSRKGDLVADPFCGSGTVLLEAQLAGRVPIGADVNPIARLITRVKTTPILASALDKASDCLFERISSVSYTTVPDVINLEHWFHSHVIRQLQRLYEAIESTKHQEIREFFQVCFSSCLKKVSLADPRLSVPVRLRSGQYPEGHRLSDKMDFHLRRLKRVNVFNVFRDVLNTNRKRLAFLEPLIDHLPEVNGVLSNAKNLSLKHAESKPNDRESKNGFVQMVITSPPYPGAQKYIRSCSLSLGWLGICRSEELLSLKRETIGREEFRKADYAKFVPTGLPSADVILRDIHAINPVRAAIASTYLHEMREVIGEISRVVKVGGYFVLVAANNQICGYEFKTQHYLRLIAEEAGFRTVLRLIDDIRSHGLMTKRNKTASVITREWVLVFVKDKHDVI